MNTLWHRLRFHNPWQYKAPTILSVVYFWAAQAQLPTNKALANIVAAGVTIAGIGAFGYILNDWADIKSDQKAGKTNHLGNFPPKKRWAFLLASLFLTGIP